MPRKVLDDSRPDSAVALYEAGVGLLRSPPASALDCRRSIEDWCGAVSKSARPAEANDRWQRTGNAARRARWPEPLSSLANFAASRIVLV